METFEEIAAEKKRINESILRLKAPWQELSKVCDRRHLIGKDVFCSGISDLDRTGWGCYCRFEACPRI